MFTKWRNHLKLALLVYSMTAFSTLTAVNSCCNAWFPSTAESCFTDDLNVVIDFLWWKPCFGEIDYAAVLDIDDGNTKVEYKSLCTDWTPGVRVIIGRPSFFYDWGFIGSYTFCESDKHSSVEEEGSIVTPLFHPIIGTDEPFDKVSADFQVCYQEWDVLITYDWSCYPSTLFTPFFGVAGIYLEQNLDLDVSIEDVEFESDWDSVYWGAGLRAGAQYQYLFGKCLRFYTLAHASLLVGEADNEYDQEIEEEIEFDDDGCCLFVSGYSIKAGFLYDTAFCDVDFTIRLGYEFTRWHNIPNHRVFFGNDTTSEISHGSSSSTRTLTYHGLFVGVGMTF